LARDEGAGPVVRRALISVSDKSGLLDLAHGLAALGIEIVSTGGTADLLRGAGIAVRPVDEVTGFPEMLDGRVRTLHPRIHAGILADRGNPTHMRAIERLGAPAIDLVVVNFYPFARVFAERLSPDAATELIDVGGPALARAAAKNASGVGVVTSPAAYGRLLDELRRSEGRLSTATRAALRREAFLATAAYDAAVAAYFGIDAADGADAAALRAIPDPFACLLAGGSRLRYGENPHQAAALFPAPAGESRAEYRVLGGKELSFNNLVDLDAAVRVAHGAAAPCAAIVKHANPCGAALDETIAGAFDRARDGDPVSAFGGIIAVNRTIEPALAARLVETFFEAVVAPDVSRDALERLAARKNLRVVTLPALATPDAALPPAREMRATLFGTLVQTADAAADDTTAWRAAAGGRPGERPDEDARFAWHVVRHVRSNAIVLVRDRRTIGVGAGQMSRVEAVQLAIRKARAAGHDPAGAALASDGFFPFPDGVEEACAAGVRVIVQPGGSVKDGEVVAAAVRGGAILWMTGRRHFRH
jgi:phosphoribosylaminoimidazolecarboxamide formyltransferase/IMP cyclohydrolase